ncbi:MAG TPA: DUF4199 domain-containing protein [Saprospiraceae bacterium]|nr:DUF4199 domain-containing protein [Saprospiraceae bacterium]
MSTTLKWGLITGMVYIILSLATNMLGVHESGSQMLGFGMNAIILVATFITIYMGVKEARDQDLGGYLTLGQGFLTGFKIALIAGIISAVFTLIYTKIIDPDFADKIMEGVEEQWDKAGMPEDQREMARKWTGYMMNPYVLTAISLVSALFWGLIKGLVAGAMLKKEAPPSTMAGA